MRELTSQHLKILKEVETQKFIDETIADMYALNISPSFPKETSNYEVFVQKTLAASHTEGLTSEKDCYVYIMAWHIIGADILKIDWLQSILEDEESFVEEKVEALQKAIDDTIMHRAKEFADEIC